MQIKNFKNQLESNKKQIDDIYKSVSLEIMSKCGLTSDVSDSIGIAYCLWKKLNSH